MVVVVVGGKSVLDTVRVIYSKRNLYHHTYFDHYPSEGWGNWIFTLCKLY
jgi:hypothetical protein